jgi:glycine oxidase
MNDCLVVGGGVIGLSIAYELAKSGVSVEVIDKGVIGGEASWAGAGILPPANSEKAIHPIDRLRGDSHRLHPEWAAALREETKIDNEYRRCGGVHLARRAGEAAFLKGMAEVLRDEGIRVRTLDGQELKTIEPALSPLIQRDGVRTALFLPDESQLRNPLHLLALKAACAARGVRFQEQVAAREFTAVNGRIERITTQSGTLKAGSYCLACGAWTSLLLRSLGLPNGVIPVRGQMVLFLGRPGAVRRIVNEGPRYVVPRIDGRVLAGSTEEEVGFDSRTTRAGVDGLVDWATSLVLDPSEFQVERTWAGLRPGSFDGFPYLGKIPMLANGFVAAGHFRSGLFLSPATAVVMSRLIRGEDPGTDLSPFRIGRG